MEFKYYQKQFLLVLFLVFCLIILVGVNLLPSNSSVSPSPTSIHQHHPHLLKPKENSQQSVIDKNKLVSVMLTGDIMLSRGVNQEIRAHHNYNYPFLKTESFIKQADIAVANLECPISTGRIIKNREMTFRADPASAKSLAEAGFDIVSLANNHTGNWGKQGIESTIKYLKSAGVKYVGAGSNYQTVYQPVIIEKKGIKIGFLAYVDPNLIPSTYLATDKMPGVASMDDPTDFQKIKELKKKVDFLIVSMHCGQEYQNKPSQKEINFAHQAIESGANLVFNSHPHIIQPVKKYHHGYILYSLGNFVFDQMWSEKTRQGVIAELILNKTGIVELNFYPFIIQNYAQPNFVFGSESKNILANLKLPLKEKFIVNNNHLISFGGYLSNHQKIIFRSNSIDKIGKNKQAIVKNNRVVIDFSNHQLFWRSSNQWKIENIIWDDVNNDNKPELVLSLWKYGRYGPDLPFWRKKNVNEWGNHLFLYQIDDDFIRQIWGSSTINNPIREINILPSPIKNKLAILNDNGLGIWQWDEWNFYQDEFWTVNKPFFLRIIKINNKPLPMFNTNSEVLRGQTSQ